MNINRRDALKYLSAGSLLAMGLWPGVLRAGNKIPPSAFRFLVINDTHYMSPECGDWLAGLVRQMKTHEDVELGLLAGDLAEYGRRKDLAAVQEIFKGLGVPVYVEIGNHDSLTQKDRSSYEKVFPNRINYFFKHRGWQFVGLDTTEGVLYYDTQIQSETFEWVRELLPKLDKEAPLAIFTHFPLAGGVRYRPGNADVLLALFLEYNLQAVFSGHFHGFTEQHIGQTVLTTNSCCALKRTNHDGTKKKGYFLCKASEGRIARTFVEYKAAETSS